MNHQYLIAYALVSGMALSHVFMNETVVALNKIDALEAFSKNHNYNTYTYCVINVMDLGETKVEVEE